MALATVLNKVVSIRIACQAFGVSQTSPLFVLIAISLTSNAISVSVSSVSKNNINSYNFASYTYDKDFEIVFM